MLGLMNTKQLGKPIEKIFVRLYPNQRQPRKSKAKSKKPICQNQIRFQKRQGRKPEIENPKSRNSP